MTAFTLLCLPLEAAAFWLAFKGRGLNYPEWLVVSAFLTGGVSGGLTALVVGLIKSKLA